MTDSLGKLRDLRGPWQYFDLASATYERFTDRARLVLALAEQFAMEQRASAIEPEHVLRGLASTGRGVGRMVLDEMGIDLFRLLPQIVELLPPNPEKTFPPTEEMLAAGLGKCFPRIQLGKAGTTCLDAAHRGAKELNHNYLGTEHLVMGLIRGQSAASTFLHARGASDELFRAGVIRVLYPGG